MKRRILRRDLKDDAGEEGRAAREALQKEADRARKNRAIAKSQLVSNDPEVRREAEERQEARRARDKERKRRQRADAKKLNEQQSEEISH